MKNLCSFSGVQLLIYRVVPEVEEWSENTKQLAEIVEVLTLSYICL